MRFSIAADEISLLVLIYKEVTGFLYGLKILMETADM